MTIRVILGTILFVATMMIISFVLVNEPARMAQYEIGYVGRSVEAGAALFETHCVRCHSLQGQGIEGLGPALNARDLFDKDNGRLKEIGWAGSVKDYVRAAIAGGRPRASAAFATFPNRMPTWSQEYGGPLRTDQVENLVDFVMNWEAEAMTQPIATAAPVADAVGTDLNTELPAGDAANGEVLFTGKGAGGKFPCSACHSLQENQTLVGPSLFGIADTAATRIEGYSAEKYIHESIVLPNVYVVEGFAQGIMPQTFGTQMTRQEAADVIAYLMTK
jgi:cytochrome c2